MPWIKTVGPADAKGRLKEIYDAAVRRAGRVFKIVEIMSLAPRALESSLDLYKAVMFGRGELTRRQREMLAVVVSRENDCHY
jgi:alkylhydroperoxidase family enzyme